MRASALVSPPDRRVPVHVAGGGRAADRTWRPAGAGIRRQGKSDLLVLSPDTEQLAAPRLPDADEHRGGPPRPRRDPRPRRARERDRPGRVADQAAQSAAEPPAETPAATGNGRGEVVTVDLGDLGPAPRDERDPDHAAGRGGAGRAAERGAARRADPGATQAPAALDGQPLQHLSHSSYKPVRDVPGGLAPALRARGEDRPSGPMFSDARSTTRSRSTTATSRPRRAPLRRPAQDAFSDGWKAGAEAERGNSGSPGTPTCARTAHSSSASTPSSSRSAS